MEGFTIDTKSIAIGLCLAIFVLSAWWHTRENKALTHQWQTLLDADTAQKMIRFAWIRTAQLLSVMAACVVMIGLYDWPVSKRADAPKRMVVQPAPPKPAAPPKPTTQSIVMQAQPIAQPTAPITASLPAITINGYYPPLASISAQTLAAASNPPSQQPGSQAPPEQEQAETDNQPATLDDVYNPEKKSNDTQSAMDNIKKRYEDLLVTYLFLNKCRKTSPSDYQTITAALGQEMVAISAPAHLQNDIISSAQGSYKEIYAHSRCDDKGMNALRAQYTDYLKTLAQNFSTH